MSEYLRDVNRGANRTQNNGVVARTMSTTRKTWAHSGNVAIDSKTAAATVGTSNKRSRQKTRVIAGKRDIAAISSTSPGVMLLRIANLLVLPAYGSGAPLAKPTVRAGQYGGAKTIRAPVKTYGPQSASGTVCIKWDGRQQGLPWSLVNPMPTMTVYGMPSRVRRHGWAALSPTRSKAMRSVIRLLAVVSVMAGSVLAGLALGASRDVSAQSPQVMMVDNDGPLPRDGIDPRTGEWGFSPYHLAVTAGEPITFTNPAGNRRPHDVFSLSMSGSPPQVSWDVGAQFNSGSSSDVLLRPEGSMKPDSSEPAPSTWTLDTGTLGPGHYTYFCTLHPWMTGTITVLPAAE
jgi:plastocyanin